MPEIADRVVTGRVALTGTDGRPLQRTPVVVEQLSHEFGFGNIGFDFIEWIGGPPQGSSGRALEFFGGSLTQAPESLAEAWLEIFNTATLPFYWRGFEPERGHSETARLHETAEWFQGQGVTVKGHPLLWHTLTPEWLLGLDDVAVEAAIRDHIASVVTDFTGVIGLWDAINEAVILPVFTAEENAVTRLAQQKGRLGMVAMAFEVAREANSDARLVLNDFDLSADYERLIEECLDTGIAIDALGLQTHMHQGYRGEERIAEIIERFSRFGLPLQLTETTLLSGDLMPKEIVDLNDYVVDSWPSTEEGEARQAEEIVRHYRNVVAHPQVESLTYWGITDEGAWLGAPSGLLRRDGSRKPAFDALRSLVREEWWHAPATVTTDDDGSIEVRGFAGSYRVATDAGAAEFELVRGGDALSVTLGEGSRGRSGD